MCFGGNRKELFTPKRTKNKGGGRGETKSSTQKKITRAFPCVKGQKLIKTKKDTCAEPDADGKKGESWAKEPKLLRKGGDEGVLVCNSMIEDRGTRLIRWKRGGVEITM